MTEKNNAGPSVAFLKALAVTCELTGSPVFSEAAVRIMAHDLCSFPEAMLLGALDRCRKELRGRLTVADVIARLDDGRPGPEEAWAKISTALGDERITVVWTQEMAEASGPARQLVLAGDSVAARMAFLESYRTLVSRARDAGRPPSWTPSLGQDPAGREGPLVEAATLGRLTSVQVTALLGGRAEPSPNVALLVREGFPSTNGTMVASTALCVNSADQK